jgi:hypothetical protein
MTDVTEALERGESVRERLPLRTGGAVAVTDDSLLVSADEELTRVALDDVAEITVQDFDYFLAILSGLLVGYGLYSVPRSALMGFAFAGFGAASLYWTYRKRGKARIKAAGRSKPISVFPTDTEAFTDAIQPALAGGQNEQE